MDKPKIKSFKLFKILPNEDEPILQLHREYNEKGDRLHEISYSLDDEIVEEKFLSYDDSGKLKEEKSEYVEDEVTEHVRYEYDEKNRISKTHKSYGEDGDEDTTYYSYDVDGNLLEKRTESSDGEVEHKEIWKFVDKNLIENVVSDYDGRILVSSKFSYNSDSVLTEEIRYTMESDKELKILYDFIFSNTTPDTTVYNKEGKIVQRSRHTYDEKQRVIKEITEIVDGSVKKFTTNYAYDEQGNLIENSVVDKNDNLISKIVYKHNQFNMPVEEIHYEEVAPGIDLKETKTITEYEFY